MVDSASLDSILQVTGKSPEITPNQETPVQSESASIEAIQEVSPVQDVAATEQSFLGGIVNQMAQGATFGFSDEAQAALLAAYGTMAPESMGGMPDAQSFVDNYQGILSEIRSANEQFKQENPLSAAVAEGGGGLASGGLGIAKLAVKPGASMVANALRGGVVGGAEAALYGAGTAEEGERIEGAKEMAPYGVVGGAALSPLVPLVGNIKGPIARIKEQAGQRKMVREGVEAPETAGLRLQDEAQKAAPVQSASEDMVEAAIEEIPEAPTTIRGALSEFAPGKPKVVKSPGAQKALQQAVPENIITNIRETNPATRKRMEQATKLHWANLQNKSDTDAFSIVGNELNKRIKAVGDSHKEALSLQQKGRKELKKVKGNDLIPSMENISNRFLDSLEGRNIKVDGAGKLDFSGVGKASPLAKGAAKRNLNNVWSQFLSAKNADDLHNLRRDVDELVKFEKGGVSPKIDSATNEILKDIRTAIKDELVALSDDYGEANRVLSQNFDAFKKLEGGMPRLNKFDLEKPSGLKAATEYIGQQIRKIDSNYASSSEIKEAIDTFDNLSSEYGKTFDTDIGRLSRHLAEIKLRLGEGKAGGLQAKTEASFRRGMGSFSPKEFLSDKMGQIVEGAQGVSDEGAYKAILGYIDEVGKN